MEKKRILCVLENLAQGGAERQLIGLATMLAKDGHDVRIITYHSDCFYKYLLTGSGVSYEYVDRARNKLLRIPIITRYIRQYAPDVVVAFLRTPSVITCCAKFLLRNFKLIVSERNTNQGISFSEKLKFFLYRAADYVVPNSYSQTAFLKHHCKRLAKKIVTITNFTDTDYFLPTTREGNSILKIACVGRICKQKNVKRLIEALRKVVDIGLQLQVNWYGLEIQPYLDECVELIKKHGLEQVFYFHVQVDDVRTVYQESDVLMLPSIYEGFPNVVCEAMSCGLPILCSDVCDNRRIVRDKENGILFDPYSINDITSAIISFSELNKEEREVMGKRSRAYALSDFSKYSFYSKYKKLILE